MTGIDYGMGRANLDTATGIRFGVISQHSLSSDALSSIWDNGDNLSWANAQADAQKVIANALQPVLDELGVLPYVGKYSQRAEDKARRDAAVKDAAMAVWETIEQEWNEQYQEDEDTYRYEQDGYTLETSSLGIFVIKSPFYTMASFCSPCAPGAGDLDSPNEDGVKTYCLGADWFDDERAPYPIFKVEDDTKVA